MTLRGYYDGPEDAEEIPDCQCCEPDYEAEYIARLEAIEDRYDRGYHEWAGQE